MMQQWCDALVFVVLENCHSNVLVLVGIEGFLVLGWHVTLTFVKLKSILEFVLLDMSGGAALIGNKLCSFLLGRFVL